MSTSRQEGCLYDPERVSLPPSFYPDNPTEITSAFTYLLTFQALACLKTPKAIVSELWPISCEGNPKIICKERTIPKLQIAEICLFEDNLSRSKKYPQEIHLMAKFLTAMYKFLPHYNQFLVDDIPAPATIFARLGLWFSQDNLPYLARTKLHMVSEQGIFVHKGLEGRANGKNYGYSTEPHNWRQIY